MTVTITINQRYRHLNADRSQVIKPGGVGVEKEVVCDVVIAGGGDFSSGQVVLDFTQVGFKQVYNAIITETDRFDIAVPEIFMYIPDSTTDAALGVLHGKDLANADVGDLDPLNLVIIIRGV